MEYYGVYQMIDPANSPTNGWVTVLVIPMGNDNENYCRQLVFPLNSHNIYIRFRSNGNWSYWRRLVTNESLEIQYNTAIMEYTNCPNGQYLTVNFDKEFETNPMVSVTLNATGMCELGSILGSRYVSKTKFSIYYKGNTNGTVYFDWIAVSNI